jgi:hypothetical protein
VDQFASLLPLPPRRRGRVQAFREFSTVKSFKDPSFQDRSSQAAEAKQKALDNLRRKPPVDEAVVAERQAARQRREAAEAEKRSARQAAEQAAREAEAAAQAEAAALAQAQPAPPTEAEKKAARDARYAARKSRK